METNTQPEAATSTKSELIERLGTWQPIETAPKDGNRFLASAVSWKTVWEAHYKSGKYGEGFSRTMYDDTGTANFKPTHWMPLPVPPV